MRARYRSADVTASNLSLTARELRSVVRTLPEWPQQFRRAWDELGASLRESKSYRSEREHLTAWLGEYGTSGYYGRKTPGRDARFFYTHFNDTYGLVWLAEALGVAPDTVKAGMAAVSAAGPNKSAQAGAFRRVIGWDQIEPLVRQRLLRSSPTLPMPR